MCMPNVSGPLAGQLDRLDAEMFMHRGLRQHVSVPTHVGGNLVDLILTRDDDVNCRLVSQLSVTSVCFSDHHLLTCQLGVPPTPPVMARRTATGSYAGSTQQFHDILCSRLYDKKAKLNICYSAPSRQCHLRSAQVHGAHQEASHIPALYLPSRSRYSFTDLERMEG